MQPDRIRPLIRYLGSKWAAARKYPEPRHDLLIEPFAGGAGYALHHYSRDVVLCDLSPTIAGIWQYLTTASQAEIMALPLLGPGQTIPLDLPRPARDLIGFWGQQASGNTQSGINASAGSAANASSYWGESIRARIAAAVPLIRHWTICLASYSELPDVEATWFVDPPYQRAGVAYQYGSRKIDFAVLGAWCQSRRGQVIACENEGATWLPFAPFGSWLGATRGGVRRPSREVAWIR
jgi:hypothetical protein